MKKKIVLTLAAIMTVSSLSFASPLSNYEQGKVAVDLNTSISPKLELNGGSDDAKNRLGAGITYGLGNKWAVQYKYADNKSKNYSGEVYIGDGYYADVYGANGQITAHELNVLYQIDPNLSAFVGWTRATAKLRGSVVMEEWSTFAAARSVSIPIGSTGSITEKQSRNGYQVGLIGQTKLADKMTGWASVAAGNKRTGYEVGVGYEMSESADLNLFYRYTKHKDFNFDSEEFDVTTKGLGAGVTFKF